MILSSKLNLNEGLGSLKNINILRNRPAMSITISMNKMKDNKIFRLDKCMFNVLASCA